MMNWVIKLNGDYSMGKGAYISAQLESGKAYEIHLTQYSKTGDYSFSVTKE